LAVSAGHLYHMDLYLFDTAGGKLLGKPLVGVDGVARDLLFSADGKRLVVNHWSTVYLVDAVARRLTSKVPAKALSTFFQGDELYVVEQGSGKVREVSAGRVGKEAADQFAEKLDSFGAFRMAVAGRPAVAAIPEGNEVRGRSLKGRELFRVVGEASP